MAKSEVVSQIRESFNTAEAELRISACVRGRSGVTHVFDMTVTKGNRIVPVDVRVASDGAVELADVLETYAKSLDTRSKPAILVAMPRASDDARKSAAALGTVLIEGSALEEVIEKLRPALDQVMRSRA